MDQNIFLLILSLWSVMTIFRSVNTTDGSTYPPNTLKTWESPPVVTEQSGSPGELGSGVITPNDTKTQNLFRIHQFNVLASDKISLKRSLKDVRSESCKTNKYPNKLPTTSVVIIFYNEAWSTLLRTVWSVINRSPRSLLEEIVLVDDASKRVHLKEKLEIYVSKLPVPVKVVRTRVRSGVVRARLLGANHVKSQVITFLDAHCECTEGWLEPLLTRIAYDRKIVASPLIDIISESTFEYILADDTMWGGFDWSLNFESFIIPKREMKRRNHDKSAPIFTPTFAGGLFSIDKDYFYQIGSYDEGMDIWGGENVEMSFRVWQCGGILELVPCSRVGHVYRRRSPYIISGNDFKIVLRNSVRVAEVWIDEWRDFFYAMNPDAENVKVGDLKKRKALRRRLKCKSFRWYLETVYPETQMPLEYHYLGEIKNAKTNKCLDTLSAKCGEKIGMNNCHGLSRQQVFVYTKRSQIMSNCNCLNVSSPNRPVKLWRCSGTNDQKWVYNPTKKTITHAVTKQCLQSPTSSDSSPIMAPCDGTNAQKWAMDNEFHWQVNDEVNDTPSSRRDELR